MVVAAGALVGLPCGLALADEPQTAHAFVASVYSRYSGDSDPQTLDARAASVFAPHLLSLIREDARLAKGEAGLLDHDPICSCQDWKGLKVTAIHIVPDKAGRARASVEFINGGRSVNVVLSLVPEGGAWRISDVREPDVPSIRRYLEKALATSKAKTQVH
jgi:hypothetical protein